MLYTPKTSANRPTLYVEGHPLCSMVTPWRSNCPTEKPNNSTTEFTASVIRFDELEDIPHLNTHSPSVVMLRNAQVTCYYSTGSQRSHRCCPFAVKVENIGKSGHVQVWPQKCPFPWGPVFGPQSTSQRHLDRFDRFCRAHRSDQQTHNTETQRQKSNKPRRSDAASHLHTIALTRHLKCRPNSPYTRISWLLTNRPKLHRPLNWGHHIQFQQLFGRSFCNNLSDICHFC